MKWLSGFEADLEREMAEWFWCDGSGLVVDAADVDVVDGAWSREVRCAVCLSIAQSLSSAWRCLVVGAGHLVVRCVCSCGVATAQCLFSETVPGRG